MPPQSFAVYPSILLTLVQALVVPADTPTLNDGAGILNGGFKYWADASPLHWDVTAGREHLVSKTTDDPQPGLTAQGGYAYVLVTQRVDASGSIGGHTIEFSAEALAVESESVKLIVQLDDGTKFHSDRHAGTGEWETLTATARIPDDYAPGFVYVSLHHYNSPARAAQFRNAQIRFAEKPSAPAR